MASAGRAWRVAVSLALGLASLAASVLLADFLFRSYERRFLVEEVEIGADDFDLARLLYNDADGYLPAAKPPGEFRILSFGDSFAESATRGEYAYANIVQRLLTQASGRRVRVANFGAAVTSFHDYLEEEHAWGRRAEHDAVLFNLYAGNDFRESYQNELYARGLTRPPLARGKREVRQVGPAIDVPHRYPLRMLDHLWAQVLTRTQRKLSKAELALYRPDLSMIAEPSYVMVQAIMTPFFRPEQLAESYTGSLYWLDALVQRAVALERTGVKVAITVAPPDFAVTRKWLELVLENQKLAESDLRLTLPEAVVSALAARRGFTGPLVMFHSCLREAEARGEDTYYGTNTHWSVRGNEIVGRVLAERLAQAWALGAELPPGEQEPCASAPPPRDLDVERFLDAVLPALDAAVRLRNRALAELSGSRHESFEAIAAALSRAGLRHEPERVFGAIDSAAENGYGGRLNVRLYAHARDRVAPASWLLVFVFRSGRLEGVGMAPANSDFEQGNFYFDLAEEPRGPIWGRHVRAVAITQTGEFAELPVTVGPLYGG